MKDLNYLSNPAMSHTKLTYFKQSPKHYQHFTNNPYEPTKAQTLGGIIQTSILNPLSFANDYFEFPNEDKRTIVGKTAYEKKIAENQGKIGIKADEYAMIVQMQAALFSSKLAKKLLSVEPSNAYYWTDEDTLVDCKAMPKIYKPGKWMADLITTTCADPNIFLYDIIKYGYHRKAAFNLEAVKEKIPYYLIVIEKQAPYGVSVIKLPQVIINDGKKENKDLLKQFSICQLHDKWPCYEAKLLSEAAIMKKLKHLRAA
jgi:hypothetical protein